MEFGRFFSKLTVNLLRISTSQILLWYARVHFGFNGKVVHLKKLDDQNGQWSKQSIYRTRVNNGRGLYSKNIFWPMIAANNRERLLIKKYFSANNIPMLKIKESSYYLKFG